MKFSYSQFCTYSILVVLALLLVLVCFDVNFLQTKLLYADNINQNSAHITPALEKTIITQEFSADKSWQLTLYNIPFNQGLFGNEYFDYEANQDFIAIKDTETGNSRYIFTDIGDGMPEWLGDNHIFYTTYCGTGCQGFDLMDVRNKQIKSGVLGYMGYGIDSEYTIFDDWTGKEFRFDGIPDDIYSQTVGDKTWLIFKMVSVQGVSLGEKKLLFDGSSLRMD